MNILIVEDDASGRKLFEVMLRKDGHQVSVAADAAAALAKLAAEKFDAILLDLNLPDGQGKELCGRIRAAAPGSQIVVASGDGTPETVKDVLAAGADDFSVKPVDHGTLRIRLAVAERRASRDRK